MCGELMKLPYMPYKKQKVNRDMIEFRGYNNTPLANEKEFINMQNLSSDRFPLISCRLPRGILPNKLAKPNALYATEKLCWIDGTKFYYDGVEKGTLTDGQKGIADMNGFIIIFPDKAYYDYINDLWGTFTAPDLDYITVWNNRVWGVKGNEIRASKLGDFKEWEDFSGEANDSYATDVGSHGDFTGIYTFQNHVVCFKPNLQYEIYGYKPSNFQVQEISRTGTTSNQSVVESYSQLFYMHDSGIYSYVGGNPRLISNSINTSYLDGVAGTDNRRYYISLYDGVNHSLFAYDTWFDMWHREDDLQVINFVQYDNGLYALTAEGDIIKFNSGEEIIDWSFETIMFDEGTSKKKKYAKLRIRFDLDKGSRIKIYVRYNERESYRIVKSYSCDEYTNAIIPIKLQPCDRFQIKVDGKGKSEIHGIERYFSLGR